MKGKIAVLWTVFLLLALSLGLAAGEKPLVTAAASATWQPQVVIANQPNHMYDEKLSAKFHPSGKLYVAGMDYNMDTQRYSLGLWCYDGETSTLVKTVSETNLQVFEPDMAIGKDGWIHLAWVEAANGNADTWYFKYRYFDGNAWSQIFILKTATLLGSTGGFNPEKIDDLDLDVDRNHNVYVSYMIWPAGRCLFLSWYNGRSYDDPFPMGGRSKHPAVAVDEQYVHLTWQQLVGSTYLIGYARRDVGEANVGKWTINKTLPNMQHRPRIAITKSGELELASMTDVPPDEIVRHNTHKFSANKGASWSGNWVTTEGIPAKYQNVDIAAGDNSYIITSQLFLGPVSNSYYCWFRNGEWTGTKQFNTGKVYGDFGCPAMSQQNVAAFVYNNRDTAILALISDKMAINEPPTAVITPSATEVFWGDSLSFSAAQSRDPDGTISLYEWEFDDQSTVPTVQGADQVNITHAFDGRWGDVTLKLWTFDGSVYSPMASQQIKVKALYSCQPTVTATTIRTLLYNRLGNVVTWTANAKNAQEGYSVAKYVLTRSIAGAPATVVYETTDTSLPNYKYYDLSVPAGATATYSVISVDAAGHQSPPTNL